MDYLVKKKSGALEAWDSDKIVAAIGKSAERVPTVLTDEENAKVVTLVEIEMAKRSSNVVPVEIVHSLVENALTEVNTQVATKYISYRDHIKHEAKIMDRVNKECNSIQFLGDKSNANADSTLISTKRVKKLDALETAQYEEYFLNAEEKKAADEGYIYIHDKGARQDTMNCCLFDMKAVLSGGFESGNIWYNEPHSVDTAFDVIADIAQMAASQQYGGFTIPEVDFLLEPYAQKSFDAYRNDYIMISQELGISEVTQEVVKGANLYAEKKVIRNLEQGFQGWEYKFNTVASSRGDYPFVTVTFGLNTSKWGKEITKAILKVRKNGQGKKGFKKPVLFPKPVFLYDETIHGSGKEADDLFKCGLSCSAKTMYPDWLSLTGEGYVADMYKKYHKVISPMGCRAFLSPWYERGGMVPADEADEPVFIGRFNIGAISLNLPMILAKSRRIGEDFYQTLDGYLEMIRKLHKRTYEYLGHMKASMNPLGFCEGGFYGGHLSPDEKIAPVLKSATASFGITALNELQQLYNGKSITEDGAFALEVMEYINNKITQYKKEDNHLYAIYGTPAESLCAKQVTQFRQSFGIVSGVSDRKYVSNSFHCHVTEHISPVMKQDKEKRFWNLFNGGKIQYVKYPIGYNIQAMEALIRRAMDMGLYEGCNMELSYCDDCGHEQLEMDVCPVCGSKNLTKIDRMNGYLAYSRVHGDTRLNEGKMAEIADRVSM